MADEEWTRADRRRERKETEHWLEGGAGIVIILLVIFETIVLCYLCSKNRSKLCGKKQTDQ